MTATATHTNRRRIDSADCAKLVRAALKQAFPSVKFSVRTDRYAGGSSVDVKWTDGPTSDAVERVAKRFEGATFDGMIDLKEYKRDSMLNGEPVSFGADYVMCTRLVSVEFAQRIADELSDRYGVEWITVTECAGDANWQDAYRVDIGGGQTLRDAIWREISKRAYTPPVAV